MSTALCACTSRQPSDSTVTTSVDTLVRQTEKPTADTLTIINNSAIDQTTNCGYDNDVSALGQGLVLASWTITLYNDSLLSDLYLKWNIDSGNPPVKPVCTKYFKPDYNIMHFVCLSKTNKHFKVLINFDQIKYLPNIQAYNFKTWGDYILQSYGLSRKIEHNGDRKDNQPIYHEPNENSKLVPIPTGLEMFCPMEVKGDWVKVKWDCFYNVEDNPHSGAPCHDFIDKCKNPLTGWVKWRQDNTVLVEIYLMP